MPTPNLYLNDGDNPFTDVPPALQNNKVDVLYVTDRAPLESTSDSVMYGHKRSTSMAFGSCIVEIGKDVSWDTLVKNSLTNNRTVSLGLSVKQTTELARFPSTPLPVISSDKGVTFDPKSVLLQKQTAAALQREVAKRLEPEKCKEAFVYIHGFNNTFDDSVFVAAELWHFMGRHGLPIVYSWPAKESWFGYGYDRESSEFTVFHFKQFLKALAGTEGLDKIHILAHSRGTGVAASSFRELVIASEAWGQQDNNAADSPGKSARAVLNKIGNVVLAAADIDMEVASQRLSAEKAFMGAERVTIYLSHEDKALNLAAWLFESIARLGELSLQLFIQGDIKTLETIDRIDFIDARVDTGFLGHAYFHSSPAVSSDLILLLRDNLAPGQGRPLTRDDNSTRYWSIAKDYPYVTGD
ncbi:MAG: alpha/beta hydrolase [Phycisphaerales bacterium]|nr:alpha/beta hydrolase [Phycisphaerales bacterium]